VLERLHELALKVCGLLERAEEDLLAFYSFPAERTWSLALGSMKPSTRCRRVDRVPPLGRSDRGSAQQTSAQLDHAERVVIRAGSGAAAAGG
jgi:hypothetical protein